MQRHTFLSLILITLLLPVSAFAEFKAGFAQRDITPEHPQPMWGYGARHDYPSTGTLDPLMAKAVVLEAGGKKAAVVGLDIGRSPTFRSMDAIMAAVKEQAGVEHVMISGSHTHHGPVIELIDEPGYGRGKFDDAVAYVGVLQQKIIEAIVEAAGNTVPAKIGWASEDTDLNRNRVSKREPKPRDPELCVLRFDTIDDKPIALVVSFAAHPVLANIMDRRWSGDWAGVMQRHVEAQSGIACVFMQGASGDLSPNTNPERRGMEGFGAAIGDAVLALNRQVVTRIPENPGIQGKYDFFSFPARLDLQDKLLLAVFKQGFFPEITAMMVELEDNIVRPRLVTVLVNKELALVGGTGEFFSDHAVRLKRESPAAKTLFFGYCNGHTMYIPTEAAVEEGGYGADPMFAWVPPHAGREMIDTALQNIARMLAGETP